MAYRTERRRSSELNLPGSKVQIGAHWKKPFSRIYDSTYGFHGKTYEDLLDPSARSRSADRRPAEYRGVAERRHGLRRSTVGRPPLLKELYCYGALVEKAGERQLALIYDSTYGFHGKTYEDLLDPSARSRSADRRPTEYPPHRLAAVPEAASWQPAGGDDFLEMTMPREHLFRPLSVNRNTRSDEVDTDFLKTDILVLSIFGVPKVSVPTNYHDQELESYLHKIRQPRDPGLKLAMMERGTRMMDDAALRRATRLTATNTDDLAAEMFSSANLQAMHHEMMS
ncbi:unnamed protein product [Notodromas monacha]|uniref:Uncharacterized protein n=1 Tax=Notodromas monacha TaxID=399045 RepID=A0A7R9G9C9_9CRUS|nr:unnamed protein product [Notodromas monacha]CAG0912724.1 unnamed protein product [Notodromas monacha]